MSGDVDFREKYEWWIESGHGAAARPEYIENEYAEAHQPRVTAEDVWYEFDGLGLTMTHRERELCQHIADLRNAAREDDDEEWVAHALVSNVIDAARCNGITTAIAGDRVRAAIRAAYRARKTR